MTQARESLSRALGATGPQAGSAAHFESLVTSSEDAILSKDADGVITSWNPAAQRLYGWTPEEAIGQRISLIIPPDRAQEEGQILGKVLAGERLDHYETDRVRKDGVRVSVSLTISPIREDDEIIGASVVARDITDRVLARRRAERLLEITSAMSREAEPGSAIRVLLTAGLEALGSDAASLSLVDESGERVELADSVGHSEEGLAGFESFPLDADLPVCVAIRGLEPVWSTSADDLAERFPPLRQADIRFEALAVLPLAVEGRAIGGVSFSFRRPRQFGAEERAFMGAIVQQAAYSLERARLFDGERRARQRLSFVAVASKALVESLDARETLERLAQLSVQHLGDWCAVDLMDDRGRLESVAITHVDRSKAELAREFRRRYPPNPDTAPGTFQVIRSGEPLLIPHLTDEDLVAAASDPGQLEMVRELGIVSVMVVPLVARGRTIGTLTFAASDPDQAFDGDDLELAVDLGRRAGLAVDTSALYNREHETALTLQRALLPGKLPEVDGLDVAARYLPAEAGLEVGGDWYDVVDAGGGRVDLMIGDVAGRGLSAAAVMGRLAIASRAYVLGESPVEEVIGGINQLMTDMDSDAIATVFQVSLDPSTGELAYIRAGHPPALVRDASGRIIELDGAGVPPIGWRRKLRLEPRHSRLDEGSTILMYTDGLIERREYDIDVGIDRLKAAFADAPEDPEEIVDFIPRELGAERVNDDIALLAARRTPAS